MIQIQNQEICLDVLLERAWTPSLPPSPPLPAPLLPGCSRRRQVFQEKTVQLTSCSGRRRGRGDGPEVAAATVARTMEVDRFSRNRGSRSLPVTEVKSCLSSPPEQLTSDLSIDNAEAALPSTAARRVPAPLVSLRRLKD